MVHSAPASGARHKHISRYCQNQHCVSWELSNTLIVHRFSEQLFFIVRIYFQLL